MSTNHTERYGLCQWEAGDKVLRTDFNQDNARIDAALADQAGTLAKLTSHLRSWPVRYTYIGYGMGKLLLSFTDRPIITHIVGQTAWVCVSTGSPKAISFNFTNGTWEALDVTWVLNGFTITSPSQNPTNVCNENQKTYYVTALLEELIV